MKCSFCDDTGLVFNGGVWACCCDAGKAANSQPSFSSYDRKKERPFFLPVWGKLNEPKATEDLTEKNLKKGHLPYKDD